MLDLSSPLLSVISERLRSRFAVRSGLWKQAQAIFALFSSSHHYHAADHPGERLTVPAELLATNASYMTAHGQNLMAARREHMPDVNTIWRTWQPTSA